MSASLEIIAELIGNNPPSICFIIAFILVLVGLVLEIPQALGWAALFFIGGIILQYLYLQR